MPVRKFVRYRNRKVHEVGSAEPHHTSMSELAVFVARGEEIEVVDDATGEDLTVAVLARILYDRCLRDSTAVPEGTLRDLIVRAAKREAA
jgi:polyhydroxyalkanoate synthesis regulator protein